jgi:RNA exonuclease 1
MWPTIPAFRSFGNIACPSGTKCDLPNCIFKHDTPKPHLVRSSSVANGATQQQEPDAKRLKLNDGIKEPVTPIASAQPVPSVFVGSILSKVKTPDSNKDTSSNSLAPPQKDSDAKAKDTLPRTATRPVSPPPTAAAAKAASKPDARVALIPRKVAKDPVAYTRRLLMLKTLHGHMVPQNDRLGRAQKDEIKALKLSPDHLNKLAVDEEYRHANEYPAVYENVLKQRMVKIKTMTPEQWVQERREDLAKERGDAPKKPAPKRVVTGLTSTEEIALLSTLTCPQDGLDSHGYVTKPISEAELQNTCRAQTSADFWEECDRCSTRFQVFPERREEDGALTTGGECRHHYGKRVWPKQAKNAVPEPTRLACCNEPVGSPGCVTHETHVFKLADPKRLALVMPFVETPENDKAPPKTAVCFDCEMGYTTHGLELMRMTVVSWPSHRPLVDVLVRPLGHILDMNTRFSGITAEQFLEAKPYDPENPKPVRKELRIVDSPYAARDLFLSHVSRDTPVLGHALENDLNTIRLIHPIIIDTVILFPTKKGLPFRHGLRTLAKWHLDEEVQAGGAAGHDSFEDARTTGELVRHKIKQKWKVMKSDGWVIRDDGVHPPMPAGTPPTDEAPAPPAPPASSMVPPVMMAQLEGKPAEKRKADIIEHDEHSEEQPAKKQA